jgi:hypothetical protein
MTSLIKNFRDASGKDRPRYLASTTFHAGRDNPNYAFLPARTSIHTGMGEHHNR